MPRAGSGTSSRTKFLPCITYQTLFGGKPIHYHIERSNNNIAEWRELEECESISCRAIITNCHCGFVYRLDAIENYIKKENPNLLQDGDLKLLSRTEDCQYCSNKCSRCHQKKKLENEKFHIYKGVEKNLCPAHSRMGDLDKHEAQKADDIKKAEKIFIRLLANPTEVSRIYGQGAYNAYMTFSKLCNDAHAKSQPRPNVLFWVTDYLTAQNGYNASRGSIKAATNASLPISSTEGIIKAEINELEAGRLEPDWAKREAGGRVDWTNPRLTDFEVMTAFDIYNSSLPHVLDDNSGLFNSINQQLHAHRSTSDPTMSSNGTESYCHERLST
ncbi:uncharacterized protein I206_103901 [Kwoniella pini CBS 10737]|uniref:Uncharacterized protein n=1 Tax=Kwoniella pini CBS 10737 TaxID=1296096 RepID=A0A1B9I3B3_9TREE|nr:uncharacterized protein I206_04526 [Kwoniella pini CBS 10737]OCF49995.1 hypothetical protein I206_04526 [Kwoniella pini CBS 10737]